MALFRRKSAQVVRRGVGDNEVEERTTRRVGRETVEVRRVRAVPEEKKREAGSKGRQSKPRPPGRESRGRTPRHVEEEIILPPETGKKQMLVRVLPTQTQVVILEGPSLVEHYVARQERTSLAGNMYLAKVKNVLPGMEAAFLDFGEPKNGVLYAGDIKVDPATHGHHPRIEQVLAEGDEVLVQVVKDAMGAKGARLTGQVTVPGRYLVLAPDSDMQGISRRLPEEDRLRLRDILRDVKPAGFGVIVRTAAAAATKEEIETDINRLVRVWELIKEEAAAGGAPRPVYEEPGLLIRVIREHFTPDFKRLLIDDEAARAEVVSYLDRTAPDLTDKVSMYQDEIPLFERYHVEDQLQKALDRKVWLKSGGHLVVDRTEALTVIDVNTGKFVGSSNLEDTVLQNNLEAAEEIGRQLRLRDIGGIIVIDFIDMEISRNRQAVLRRLKETLAKDKVRTQVFDVSNLGLVEMTRKNVSAGLLEQFSEVCPTCSGRGIVLHEATALRGLPFETDDDVEVM
ncbi:MAG: Rne/Rng family ribonuclease [Acidimicrobiia bacterium]|nr:Rne/Rng family ribonuclease [Acidimicrobiia bacterium]